MGIVVIRKNEILTFVASPYHHENITLITWTNIYKWPNKKIQNILLYDHSKEVVVDGQTRLLWRLLLEAYPN